MGEGTNPAKDPTFKIRPFFLLPRCQSPNQTEREKGGYELGEHIRKDDPSDVQSRFNVDLDDLVGFSSWSLIEERR